MPDVTQCFLCHRVHDRDGRCPVCRDGGPKTGDHVEWYVRRVAKSGAISTTPKEGKILESRGREFVVRTGAAGTGPRSVVASSAITRVIKA